MKREGFPFSALVGLERVKRACLLCLVNPACGGLLVSGGSGTGKSVALRSAASLTEDPWVEVPLNIDEDRLFGALDMEEAVRSGKRRLSPGLLEEARGGILYLDDVNLLRGDLTAAVTDIAEAGSYCLEREGISDRRSVSYTVMGVMNPEEGALPPALLDGFGLFAQADTSADVTERADIVRRVTAWEKDPRSFRRREEAALSELAGHIQAARERLFSVVPGEDMLRLAAVYALRSLAPGHRADLYLTETARAAAAWDGRSYVLPRDLEEAALYVLPHRMRQMPEDPPSAPPPPEQAEKPEDRDDGKQGRQDGGQEEGGEDREPPSSGGEGSGEKEQEEENQGKKEKHEDNSGTGQDRTDRIDRRTVCPPAFLDSLQDRTVRRGSGKRSLTRTDLKQGRYVRSVPADRGPADLAFDATLRAAAPYQKRRRKQGCAVVIRPEDMKNKVREKRTGAVFVFAVDASGSMGARERMSMVKGVLFRILCEAYEKRDRVCLIAFRRDSAELLLPVTRSMELAEKCLASLPTGGRTPLAGGLDLADRVIGQIMRQDPDRTPSLILVTDGRANAGPSGTDPRKAALEAARRLGERHVPAAVIDTETGFLQMGMARETAEALGGSYYSMDHLSEERLLRIVRRTEG